MADCFTRHKERDNRLEGDIKEQQKLEKRKPMADWLSELECVHECV